MLKKLDQAGMDRWVNRLIRERTVYGVQADGERFSFKPLAAAGDLRLDYDVTKIPPKKFFQPPCEALLRFDEQGACSSVCEAEPFVLFGVHPYDMVAILQMDRLFAEGNADAHYLARREQATIVVSDVQRASANVFAGCMGTATLADGFDVLVTRVGDAYIVDSRTEKGEALLARALGGRAPDRASLARREQVWEDNARYLRKHELRMEPADVPGLLERSFDHPVWAEKAEKCFSCGSCNLTCPTCYCFDVRDDVEWNLKAGERRRYWDGCMLTNFATVAGNHNFRKSKTDRYRHRYYRKGLYVPGKLGGELSCVGCGRCVTACVARIANPVEVFNRLREER